MATYTLDNQGLTTQARGGPVPNIEPHKTGAVIYRVSAMFGRRKAKEKKPKEEYPDRDPEAVKRDRELVDSFRLSKGKEPARTKAFIAIMNLVGSNGKSSLADGLGRHVRRIARSDHDAEDILTQAFAKLVYIFDNEEYPVKEYALEAYIFLKVRTIAEDYYRRTPAQRKREESTFSINDETYQEITDGLATTDYTDITAFNNELKEAYRRSLQDLKIHHPDWYQAWTVKEDSECKFEEAAQIILKPVSTISDHCQNAREWLKAKMRPYLKPKGS